MNRRGFLLACGTGLAVSRSATVAGQGRAAVEATPTLFHGHPDGISTLVRFSATDLDVPAGRLRVLDLGTGRLLGTAGMIRRDDRLVGELWLPLVQPTRIRSELETPAGRGVLRSVHELRPTPRWTIYWLTLASPDAVRTAFTQTPPLVRAVVADPLIAAGVRVNPWRPLPPGADHLDLVRLTAPAAAVSRATGIPLARLALVDGVVSPHIARALQGAAVPLTMPRSRVVDPRSLDLSVGSAAAMARIEAWLRTRASLDADQPPLAVAIGGDLDFALGVQAEIDRWNTAFAFPRFAVGDGDEALRVLAATQPDDVPFDPERAVAAPDTPRSHEPDPEDAFQALAAAAAPDEPTLTGLARRFAAPVSGVLVFNPSPFGRSGTIRVADGGLRVVTDVPGLGYAFVPDAPVAETIRAPDAIDAMSDQYAVRLDRSSGALSSVVHRPSGTELVARGAMLNQLPDAVLSAVHGETIPGVGMRIVARRVTAREVLLTTVTVFDRLPWVDIENRSQSPLDGPLRDWTFAFAHPTERARWEVPGGTHEAEPPVGGFRPIRWTALRGNEATVLFGSERAGGGSVDASGRLTALAPASTRFRIGYHRGHVLPDDPWRFGFAMRPLIAVPVDGTGDRVLPTFGRMLDIADPTVAVLAIQPAEDGLGVMVFLQELGGMARDIIVRPGVLGFESALLTDLAERDLRGASPGPDGGILVPIAAEGYAAVRLLGLSLNG